MSDHKLLSTREIAEHFRVRPETVLLWVSRGLIPSIKAGKARRYDLEEVTIALRRSDPQGAVLAREVSS